MTDRNDLRTVVYGAGAIGGVLGGHLALVGRQVILIGRSGHVSAIQNHGLRLVTPAATHILRLAAVTSPGEIEFEPRDVIFLCVKSQDTDSALRELHAVVKDVPIFCFQNGVRNEEIAARHFSRVYGVRLHVAALFISDGEVVSRQYPPGNLIIGRYPDGRDDLAEAVAANMREAGFYAMVTSDVMPYKWAKLMRNLANNAPVAITDAEDARISEAVKDEAREILSAAGIRWISDKEVALEWPESAIPIRATTDDLGSRFSSTWQSLNRRQGDVEADFFNGEIVRLAQRLGRKAPINETVLRIVQEMAVKRELPGKYTTAELRTLLGLN